MGSVVDGVGRCGGRGEPKGSGYVVTKFGMEDGPQGYEAEPTDWYGLVEKFERKHDVEIAPARFAEVLQATTGRVSIRAADIAAAMEDYGCDSVSQYAKLSYADVEDALRGKVQLGRLAIEKVLEKAKLMQEVHRYMDCREKLYEHEWSPYKGRRDTSEGCRTPISAHRSGSGNGDAKPAAGADSLGDSDETKLGGSAPSHVSPSPGSLGQGATASDDAKGQPDGGSLGRDSKGRFVKGHNLGGKGANSSASASHSRERSASLATTVNLGGVPDIPEGSEVVHPVPNTSASQNRTGDDGGSQGGASGGTARRTGGNDGESFNPPLNQMGQQTAMQKALAAAVQVARNEETLQLQLEGVLYETEDGKFKLVEGTSAEDCEETLAKTREQLQLLKEATEGYRQHASEQTTRLEISRAAAEQARQDAEQYKATLDSTRTRASQDTAEATQDIADAAMVQQQHLTAMGEAMQRQSSLLQQHVEIQQNLLEESRKSREKKDEKGLKLIEHSYKLKKDRHRYPALTPTIRYLQNVMAKYCNTNNTVEWVDETLEGFIMMLQNTEKDTEDGRYSEQRMLRIQDVEEGVLPLMNAKLVKGAAAAMLDGLDEGITDDMHDTMVFNDVSQSSVRIAVWLINKAIGEASTAKGLKQEHMGPRVAPSPDDLIAQLEKWRKDLKTLRQYNKIDYDDAWEALRLVVEPYPRVNMKVHVIVSSDNLDGVVARYTAAIAEALTLPADTKPELTEERKRKEVAAVLAQGAAMKADADKQGTLAAVFTPPAPKAKVTEPGDCPHYLAAGYKCEVAVCQLNHRPGMGNSKRPAEVGLPDIQQWRSGGGNRRPWWQDRNSGGRGDWQAGNSDNRSSRAP